MKLKVCGLREPDNIRALRQLPIDFAGFIFYEKSARFVGHDWAGLPPEILPASVQRVGVFVNAAIGQMLETVERFALDLLQLHGNESPATCFELSRQIPVVKAFGVGPAFDFDKTQAYAAACRYFLFDTQTPAHGGSGKKFDWSALERYRDDTPFLLSGGIGPEDAGAVGAFRHPRCLGVDLNSRFEVTPAIKDFNKLHFFLNQL